MDEESGVYLRKAEESLAGANSEFVNGRYNNAANRCYYACFQAAVHALIGAGILPMGGHSWKPFNRKGVTLHECRTPSQR